MASHSGDILRGEIATAHRAFHRRGPARGGPVTCQENARPRSLRTGPIGIDARPWRVGRVDFLNYRGLYEIRIARGGEEFAQFLERDVSISVRDLSTRVLDELTTSST